MLLAIDVGNTKIAFGVFDGEELKATMTASTGLHRLADDYASLLFNLLPRHDIPIDCIHESVVCSVVPPLVPVFEEMCGHYFKSAPLVIESGVKTGVRLRIDNPKELGADRVVNAAAVYRLYGGPAVVIDFGTATTFDIVSAEGEYTGGVIAPGMEIAAEALFIRAAKLPRVELTPPKHVIGKNSITAMQSGIIFGYTGLVERILAGIQEEIPQRARIVATGGYVDVIARQSPIIEIVNRDLTLIGLRLIYELNRH